MSKEMSRRAIARMSNGHLVRCTNEGEEKPLDVCATVTAAYWCKCVHCGKLYRGHTIWAVRHLESAHGIKWWKDRDETTEKLIKKYL